MNYIKGEQDIINSTMTVPVDDTTYISMKAYAAEEKVIKSSF